MSRIGKQEILIPENVKINLDRGVVTVKGPNGELKYTHRPEISVRIEDENRLICDLAVTSKRNLAFWGLTRALIANMVQGVSQGFEKKLQLVGVGYRANLKSPKVLSISVGFSNPVDFDVPEGITIEVEDSTSITIKGFDKALVGLTAAQIRKIRKPEPYKGKGIRYVDENVRRKAGKAGKV